MAKWHSNFGHFYMDAESYKRAMREDREAFEMAFAAGNRLSPPALTASWPEELHAETCS